MSTFEIFYFPIQGLGELPRLICEAGGLSYTNRFPESWPGDKSNTVFGTLPVLTEKDGEKCFSLAQSTTICRYLAKKCGLLTVNKDMHKEALVESILDAMADLRTPYWRIIYGPAETKDASMTSFFSTTAPSFCNYLSEFISKHGQHGWTVGGCMTVADLAVFQMFACMSDTETEELLKGYGLIKAVIENVKKSEKIAQYLASDRRNARKDYV